MRAVMWAVYLRRAVSGGAEVICVVGVVALFIMQDDVTVGRSMKAEMGPRVLSLGGALKLADISGGYVVRACDFVL